MRRRTFLQTGSSAMLLPLATAGCTQAQTDSSPAAAMSGPVKLENFGLQLSTLNSLMLQDFEGTLAKVAEIGYRQVEFSAMGFLGRNVEQVQQLLDKNGLEAPVGRVTPRLPDDFFTLPRKKAMAVYMARSQPEHFLTNVEYSLDAAVALGQASLILPALTPNRFETLDQVRANIELLNSAGELCARQGVVFGYHNHNWELAPIGDVIPYDLMIEQTSPDQITFQLDAYWVKKGGGNLSDYLRRYAGRFSSCHLKDIDAAGDFADVGSGLIDFPRFVREAQAQGARHFFVERDNPPEPEKSVRASFAYLSQMTL